MGFEGVGVRRMDEIPQDAIGLGGADAATGRVDFLHHEFANSTAAATFPSAAAGRWNAEIERDDRRGDRRSGEATAVVDRSGRRADAASSVAKAASCRRRRWRQQKVPQIQSAAGRTRTVVLARNRRRIRWLQCRRRDGWTLDRWRW